MIVKTPPMGWNSWNTFGSRINEQMIFEMADAMAAEGLPELGYTYFVIDDCWSEPVRDANGRLVASREKFPHGMKYVADYVHARGLKFGMYSCAGATTCAGYPGSYNHEFEDAATFAEWGVDFLKYDYCFRDQNVPGEVLYRRMGLALANCGRDILFSACNWGADNAQKWIKTTGAHMWRSTGDVFDSFGSISSLFRRQFPLQETNGQGCFNDMDMLVVGMSGKGNVARDKAPTADEYRLHFSAWAMMGSPLMIGCDIRNMTEETKAILKNKEIIAIDQDPAYRQVFFSRKSNENQFIACRFLEGGDVAIGFFNLSDNADNLWDGAWLTMPELGWTPESGKTVHLKDLWTGEEFDVRNELFRPQGVPAHSCKMYRASLVDKK